VQQQEQQQQQERSSSSSSRSAAAGVQWQALAWRPAAMAHAPLCTNCLCLCQARGVEGSKYRLEKRRVEREMRHSAAI